jgi:hypothetical protein
MLDGGHGLEDCLEDQLEPQNPLGSDFRPGEDARVQFVKELVCLVATPWLFEIKGKQNASGVFVVDNERAGWGLPALDGVESLARKEEVEFALKAPLDDAV